MIASEIRRCRSARKLIRECISCVAAMDAAATLWPTEMVAQCLPMTAAEYRLAVARLAELAGGGA